MKRNESRKVKAVRKNVTTLKNDKKRKGCRTGVKTGQFGMGRY